RWAIRQAIVFCQEFIFGISLIYIKWGIGHYKITFSGKVMWIGVKAITFNNFTFNSVNGKVHFSQFRVIAFQLGSINCNGFVNAFIFLVLYKMSCLYKHSAGTTGRIVNYTMVRLYEINNEIY